MLYALFRVRTIEMGLISMVRTHSPPVREREREKKKERERLRERVREKEGERETYVEYVQNCYLYF
jgi:hypothetical protein